jgi:peptide deformylase
MFKRKARYEVRTAGDPVLSRVAAPVGIVTDEIKQLAEKMFQSMVAFDGIGLAAPQYGESLRLIVIDVPLSDEEKAAGLTPFEESMYNSMPMALVNPEITAVSGDVAERDEGCLSVPDRREDVARSTEIIIEYTGIDPDYMSSSQDNSPSAPKLIPVRDTISGFTAVIFQHEIDHLDGSLYIDRL